MSSATVTATPAGGKGDASTRRGSYGPTRLTGKTVLGGRGSAGGWMDGGRGREGRNRRGGRGGEGLGRGVYREVYDWGAGCFEIFLRF